MGRVYLDKAGLRLVRVSLGGIVEVDGAVGGAGEEVAGGKATGISDRVDWAYRAIRRTLMNIMKIKLLGSKIPVCPVSWAI